MPGGPFVNSYKTWITTGPVTEHGFQSMIAKAEVDWNPQIQEVITKREAIHGINMAHELNNYHSQAAFSGQWLLLNQVAKKIKKTREGWTELLQIRESRKNKWLDLVEDVLTIIKDDMTFDPVLAFKYVKDHDSSSVIPSSDMQPSLKWSQLVTEELRYLFHLGKAFLEQRLTDPRLKYRIHQPEVIGRGIRARPVELGDVKTSYELKYDNSRQVGFIPYESTGYAFLPEESKTKVWEKIKQEAESILGIEVLFPPLAR